ncbi:RNA polymerase recycling motor HelD [Thalassobacillus hwangdonensis]|uniref:RNA polymerase recycling motor HelD n=1 Tax=Thalassobacillus hwangdonensis TaxID=546108 RepID=A0ABW3L2A9_9BACI
MGNEIRKEQDYLDKVMATVAEQISEVEADTSKRKDEVITMRKHFWDDLKVNMDTFDDYLETIIGMRQQAQDLSVSQSTHRYASERLKRLKRLEKTPYFGRIDFHEEGTEAAEEIRIGVSTLMEEANDDILIYDWRAPVSSVYYDYPPGSAAYDTPEGMIEGELEKKYQYIIKGGTLESMFDTSITIGDEILQQVLGQGSNPYMHSIVATIQREQNKIIRHDRKKLLIVQGAAGSGKTSAALQRIAYILYKYRETLLASEIVLFSPNQMFSSYVSHVLPELGEENMQQETFQGYLEYRLGDSFDVEDPYDQLEYLLEGTDDPFYKTRKASIAFKSSASFFDAIRGYQKALETAGMIFKGLRFRGEMLVSAVEISEYFYSNDTSLTFPHRIERLGDWLLKLIEETEEKEKQKSWVQEEIELLSKDELQQVFKKIQKSEDADEDSFDFHDKEKELLVRMVVRRRLKPLREKVKRLQFINMKKLYWQLFDGKVESLGGFELPEAWIEVCAITKESLANGRLFQEDATPYLLLQELIQGFHSNTAIKHVFIDEAQDYSVFQFEFLRRLFPAARMTVLGDFNQAIFAHSDHFEDFHSLTGLYGEEETESIILERSYRSTKQIIEFTRELIPEGQQIKAFEREGEKPELSVVPDQGALNREIAGEVNRLKERGASTVAVICKSAAESERAFEALRGLDGVKLVRKNSDEYERGVVVIPAYLAKGIEFDAVIIYNASNEVYSEESLRRLFYTACTRAMHHLHLYSVGKPSAFLTDRSEEFIIQK